jgi:TIR domain/Caspase domain
VPDVFISYSREDRQFAQRLAQALEKEGFSVWWDWDLIGGANYRAEIRSIINEAKKAIVLWSRHSVESGFVIDEATEAKKLGKLIPVLIDQCEAPFGFGDLHTITIEPHLDVAMVVAAIRNQPLPRKAVPPPTPKLYRSMAVAVGLLAILTATLGAYWYNASINQPNQPASTLISPSTPLPQRIALVIGNSNYRTLPSTPNAGRDADLVTRELERRGFNVVSKRDLTRGDMVAAITAQETILSTVGGIGVFYFAGQAVYAKGADIILPTDASIDKAQTNISLGVNVTQLQKDIESRTTQQMKNNGVATIYSASKGELAADGPLGGNSPFTKAFALSLSHKDDELSDIFRRITLEMQKSAQPNWKQTPYIEGTLGIKFYFNKPELDTKTGITKILFIDSCRDNPF